MNNKDKMAQYRKKLYENRMLIVGLVFVMAVLAVGCLMLYKSETSKIQKNPYYVINNMDKNTKSVKLEKNDKIRQKLYLRYAEVESLDFMFRKVKLSDTGRLHVELIEIKSGVCIDEWNLSTSEIHSFEGPNNNREALTRLMLKQPLILQTPKYYEINIWLEGVEHDEFVEIGVTDTLNFADTFFINGKSQSNGIVLGVAISDIINANYLIVLIGIIFLLLFVFLFYSLVIKKKKIEHLFLGVAFGVGMLYILILTPYSSPDEYRHIDTVFYHSSNILGQESMDSDGNVLVREEDNILDESSKHASLYTISLEMQHLFDINQNGKMVSSDNEPLGTPVVGYIPQIMGVTLARIMNLGQIPMLLIGRIFALLFHVGISAFAISKIPFGKMFLFTMALLPMVMQQATSFSYDGVVNTLSFFFIAYCLHLAYGPSSVQKKDVIFLIVTAAWLAPCKAVYVLLCFLVLIIPKEKFKNKKQEYLIKGSVLVVAISMVLIFNIMTVARLTSLDRVAEVAWEAETKAYTMADFLAQPTEFAYLLWNSLGVFGDAYFFQAFGTVLGWMDIPIQTMIIMGFVIVALIGVMKQNEKDMQLRFMAKIWCCCIITGVALGVFFAMLLDWTPKESWYIAGVQGRYFLPIIPLIFLLIRNNAIFVKKKIDGILIYTIYLLQFCSLYQITACLINR